MLNLYYDPHGSKIFDMSKPVAGAEVSNPPPTPTAGSLCTQCESERETVARDREEALKEKERRISELEKELSLIKVRRYFSSDDWKYMHNVNVPRVHDCIPIVCS